MTMLPARKAEGQEVKLGLVIDLDTCVGCHACAVNCKEWNTGGHSAPLPDNDPYGTDPNGVWFNRIHTVRGRSRHRQPHGSLPALMPALRRCGLRHCVPYGRFLQA